MGFDWKEYHEVARFLSRQPQTVSASSEAFWRAAISRAYYSVFNIVCAIGIDRRWFEDTGDGTMHYVVIDHLLESRNLVKLATGERLDRLRKNRNTADYRGNVLVAGKDCDTAIYMAYKIIQDIPNLPR